MGRVATGIVMDVSSSDAIIMTRDGEFLKVKKPISPFKTGEEITSAVITTRKFNLIKFASLAAALFLVFTPFVYFKEAYATVAYIDVDMNPSIEMGINRFNKVQEVIALNDDAAELLTHIDIKNKDITEALDSVITGAKDKGYIGNEEVTNIEISLIKVKDNKVNISEEKLAQCAENAASKVNLDASIKVTNTERKSSNETKNQSTASKKPSPTPAKAIDSNVKADAKTANQVQGKNIQDKADITAVPRIADNKAQVNKYNPYNRDYSKYSSSGSYSNQNPYGKFYDNNRYPFYGWGMYPTDKKEADSKSTDKKDNQIDKKTESNDAKKTMQDEKKDTKINNNNKKDNSNSKNSRTKDSNNNNKNDKSTYQSPLNFYKPAEAPKNTWPNMPGYMPNYNVPNTLKTDTPKYNNIYDNNNYNTKNYGQDNNKIRSKR
ncbi:anti-sigma-I factor RsgI [Oxobacter pfennigii]|uniref:Anti-sigma-I factor RsgI n=1 Tax=Oxobacter pfennigii TaxID=36849 RepID=A0A0P8WKI2_9CLOT|nr:anti-sigma factor domain-containing protein [Oxobacter pfennigii]KPU42833.1 anti-sigma-I factor RsgI [Oxobacter pfennigii]